MKIGWSDCQPLTSDGLQAGRDHRQCEHDRKGPVHARCPEETARDRQCERHEEADRAIEDGPPIPETLVHPREDDQPAECLYDGQSSQDTRDLLDREAESAELDRGEAPDRLHCR